MILSSVDFVNRVNLFFIFLLHILCFLPGLSLFFILYLSFRLISISILFQKLSTSYIPVSPAPSGNEISAPIVVFDDEFDTLDVSLQDELPEREVSVQPAGISH